MVGIENRHSEILNEIKREYNNTKTNTNFYDNNDSKVPKYFAYKVERAIDSVSAIFTVLNREYIALRTILPHDRGCLTLKITLTNLFFVTSYRI